MNIIDFLPKYPNIDNSKYDVLNPYEEDFYEAIFHKKEFYENRLERTEIFPKERGMLTKYQKTIVRYLSSHTPYDRLLLVHSMGLGKGCSAIGSIEQIKSEDSTFTGALILAKGEGLLDNFQNEIVEKCTSGYYIPANYSKLTDLEKSHRIKKKIKFYQFDTFAKLAKELSKLSDGNIIEKYSNKIMVIDEVHNLRPQKEDIGTLETYNQFHRMLHLIKNSKVLFLSGTPMKDGPEEIADVANLFLSLEEQLPTGINFLEEYMRNKDNVYYVKPDKIKILKEKLKGKISFLREPESTIPKEFLGEKNFQGLKHLIVSPNRMSSFQTKSYKNAYTQDKTGKKGVYINSREASLFVYPDGSYGKEGFTKYIEEVKSKKFTKKGVEVSGQSSYRMSSKLIETLRGSTDKETLKNIRKHSSTYAEVIEKILNTPGICFIYSSLYQGSGAILFSLILELFGFTKSKGKDVDQSPRYALLAGDASSKDIKRISARSNRKDNMHGEFIKVIIGTRAISEGYSFRNVLFESINTPHWNYSETAQAISRGIRLGSHNDLVEAGENPVVKIFQPVSIPSDNSFSIDLDMYQTSEKKDIGIRGILRILMENAFDCALNYIRNYVKGIDGSRECDYTKCNYSCDGIDMKEIKKGIDEEDLDYSTYQLYYANPKTPLIRSKIEQLFRENRRLDLESILKSLEGQFTEEEIKNALYVIQEESEGDEFDYRTFLNIYSRTPVKIIMNEIEKMFKTNFKLDFNSILENFGNYTEFEVLSALQNIINNNLTLLDKYGFSCYLREENNEYFLVSSLSASPNILTEYYTEYPNLTTARSFENIMNRIYSLSIPMLVTKLFETSNEKEFVKIIRTIPISIQELLIESSITSQENKSKKGFETRERILKYFENYIKKIKKVYISTLLKNTENILRCYDSKYTPPWSNCNESYQEKLQEYETEKQQKLRENNPYQMIGKYNPENESFCIVDYKKEKEAKEKLSGKKVKQDVDRRVSYSGKVCGAGGWKLDDLLEIVIQRLKINAPESFRKDESQDELLEIIEKDSKLKKYLSKNPDKNELKRILYWSSSKKQGGSKGIKPICTGLKNWLEEKNLLEIDNQCGVQGKKKVEHKEEKVEKKKGFRIEVYNPKDENFKVYIKDISKSMEDCFGIKKYKPDINDSKWILVFLKKKLVGFVTMDKDNTLSNVCVSKNYRRQGIPKEAMKKATEQVCNIQGKQPSLYVDNRNKDAKKHIRMYISFGFQIVKTDDRYTYLQHSCK